MQIMLHISEQKAENIMEVRERGEKKHKEIKQ
jgi:hypothetical protein